MYIKNFVSFGGWINLTILIYIDLNLLNFDSSIFPIKHIQIFSTYILRLKQLAALHCQVVIYACRWLLKSLKDQPQNIACEIAREHVMEGYLVLQINYVKPAIWACASHKIRWYWCSNFPPGQNNGIGIYWNYQYS